MRCVVGATNDAAGSPEELNRVVSDVWEGVEGETEDSRREKGGAFEEELG